jgi:tripartite-type tricarboxylate transporter receptor subunit TctC
LWPGYEASGTQGIGVPRKTPVEIIDKLNREINAGLYDSTMRARITNLGNTPLALSPAEYGKLLAQETEKWGKVVKFAGLKPD